MRHKSRAAPSSPSRAAEMPATTSGHKWTMPDDIRRAVRRKWDNGALLGALAAGKAWEPMSLAVHGPVAGELASRFAEVQEWVRAWEQVDSCQMRVECRRVGGRIVGANSIPRRVWIDSYSQLWRYLDVESQVSRFSDALDHARASSPRLVDWIVSHPMHVLGLETEWDKIIDTVDWIDTEARPGSYLRQVDVPGVDTKFIERHRGVLSELLDLQLDHSRIDRLMSRSDFAGRYGFSRKPSYVRFRLPGHTVSPARTHGASDGRPRDSQRDSCRCHDFSEMAVRVDELTAAPVSTSSVYVIENEITYLAFPIVSNSIVIFGGGYAVSVLKPLTWVSDCDLIYWGDVDTHGLAILSRVRQMFPHARSMLMDRATLLEHEAQWVTESNPATADLEFLSADESDLYRDLVEDALGPSVRLEQERVRFSAIERALRLATPGRPALFRAAAARRARVR